MSATKPQPLPFGTVLGYAPGGVAVYSSDYASADPIELPDRHSFRHYVDKVYTGYKWQCVEFARRWLLLNRGYVFEDIAMAYDIFRIPEVKRIEDGEKLPLRAFANGSRRPPEPGCMLIWSEGGEFEETGHVAIVTEVLDDCIRIAEQNLNHLRWPEDCDYGRELPACYADDGSFWVQCSFEDASILGWVIQTDDNSFAEQFDPIDPHLFQIKLQAVTRPYSSKAWLNIANPDEAAYVAANGNKLCSVEADQDKYFCLSQSAVTELKRASNELHPLFMHATDYVLQNEKLLEKFNIPQEIWPRIHQSWNNRRNQMITGRLDFCLTEQGLKVYEYNADSASCHMECGKIQGLWAKHSGCDEGVDAGAQLFQNLVEAWKGNDVDDLVHIMLDKDQEETYHALYMKGAMEKAGIECKVIRGVNSLRFGTAGEVLDRDGNAIRWVWKTWAWETALDQLRAELNDTNRTPGQVRFGEPRLMDVLFQPQTMVIEPLWTLIPSNKAILPILWQLFPDHPFLLESHFELTDNLRQKGYVSKPIAGRCGLNISIVDSDNTTLDATSGRFEQQDYIYQQLWRLPRIGGYNTQICSFLAEGRYAGACTRVDSSLIITNNSDIMPLRVVSDKDFLEL
ncbi:bifunctional glutathionylspermidine amidase/synthase [Pseudomaricurvus alcaniphilus]|uniref:bifunctional glutathionylspermidine amidase/synthase n=1 Tax=Pseudomaricurvus alcaniphilus TaxID=1166482 RepID=UPI00140E5D43|nr:bifunctional glutathionylspermidine amidase/synthase [Pseudomaricurvus alcaniphilus]NHN36120.1 bifunctional glutathionylspermidine amidase/synthase [Pseudomaricurvus alcaniphilus]